MGQWAQALRFEDQKMGNNFHNCVEILTRRWQDKALHGGNKAPKDWWAGDHTLQSKAGRGICKGIASGWVTAFLNQVPESVDAERFEQYYKEFLRFQATFITDYGRHIGGHLDRMAALSVPSNIQVANVVRGENVELTHIPAGRWAAYVRVWRHDIALGGTWGHTGRFYIVEPNQGLFGYTFCPSWMDDVNSYIRYRQMEKNPTDRDVEFHFCRRV
jgi:hypothetical protein